MTFRAEKPKTERKLMEKLKVKFKTIETLKLAGLAVSGSLLFLALVALTPGCSKDGGSTVSGPDTTTVSNPAPAPAPAPEATPAPAPTPAPTPGKYSNVDAWIKAGGAFYAKNLADSPARFVFYTTSFDKQTYTEGDPKKEAIVASKDYFEGTFDATCRQIDGAFNSTNGTIFVAAFLDKNGDVFKNDNSEGSNAKITECRNPGCPPGQERDEQGICRPPRKLTCEDFENVKPTITGTPAIDNDGSERGFEGQGTVLPTGGTFSPALPYKTSTPEATIKTTYTLGYGPIIGDGETKDYLCHVDPEFSYTFPKAECVNTPVITYGDPTYGPWSKGEGETACGTRTKTVVKTTTNSCTQQSTTENIVTTETKTCSCSVLNPNKGAITKSIAKVVTSTPAQYVYDFDNTNSEQRATRQTACQNEGGTWSNTSEGQCTTPVDHGSSWNFSGPNGDKIETIAAKYSVTVTLTYSIAAGAAQSVTFNIEYVQNGPDFVKKYKTVQVPCGQAVSGTLVWGQGDTYNNSPNYDANDGHVTGSYVATSN